MRITWGVDAYGLCTLVCDTCGAVFDQDLRPHEVIERRDQIEHKCPCEQSDEAVIA